MKRGDKNFELGVGVGILALYILLFWILLMAAVWATQQVVRGFHWL